MKENNTSTPEKPLTCPCCNNLMDIETGQKLINTLWSLYKAQDRFIDYITREKPSEETETCYQHSESDPLE
jgi:hypothetical protein